MTDMRAYTLCIVISVLMAGCAYNGTEFQPFLYERQQMALQLEEDGRLAESLVQWHVLQQMYPEDAFVAEEKARVSQRIDARVEELRQYLKRAEAGGDEHSLQSTYLKILALQPDNQQAFLALRASEKGRADSAALLKATNIKRRHVAQKKKSKKSSDAQQFLLKANSLLSKDNLQGLLQLSEEYLRKYPASAKAQDFRYQALVALGNKELENNEPEEAVELFDMAMDINSADHSKLAEKTAAIKRQLSNDYFRKGMRNFMTDIAKAVEYLQASVFYNPMNLRAKEQLIKATRIQINLRKLDQSGRYTKTP